MRKTIILGSGLLAVLGIWLGMNYQSPPHPSKFSKLTPTETLASLSLEPFTTERQALDLLMAREKFSSRIGLADRSSWKYSRYETFLPALRSITHLDVSQEGSTLKLLAAFNKDVECISDVALMAAPAFKNFEEVRNPHVGYAITVLQGQVQTIEGQKRHIWLRFRGISEKCLLTIHLEQNNQS